MERYQPLHERFARFCKSRAYGDMPYRDLMQETIVVCFQKMDTIKEESFLSYLFSTAIRILANHARKKTHDPLPEAVEFTATDLHSNAAANAANTEWLNMALRELPADQREALTLFEISGFATREIAGIQGVSEAAVRQRLSRGRAALAGILEKLIIPSGINKTS